MKRKGPHHNTTMWATISIRYVDDKLEVSLLFKWSYCVRFIALSLNHYNS